MKVEQILECHQVDHERSIVGYLKISGINKVLVDLTC